MAVTGIGTYASYTNSYGNTQNAGNKTGRTYKNAHEYKNYLTQKYDCLRSRDYSVNINSSLLSEAMGDEKTKQWLEYNLSLIPESIEKLKAAQSARGCKVLSVTDTINGYDSITEEVLVTDEVDPGTEKARKEGNIMKLGKKNAMETGTFMAYACSCNCWCACTCNNCQSIGSANGKQVASNTQTSTTQVKSKGSLLLLA